MKKKLFLICFIIIYFSSCYNNAKNDENNTLNVKVKKDVIYDGKVNDSRVRLRDEPNLNSNTLTHLNINDKVIILNKSNEKELIEFMYSYWYQVRTADGTEGWMYGYFLDIDKNSTFYINKIVAEINIPRLSKLLNYNIEQINLNPEISTPDLESKVDLEVYKKLAGIYTDYPVSLGFYTNIESGEFSWGNDYWFSRGQTIIDISDFKLNSSSDYIWTLSSGGGVDYLKIISVENNVVTIEIERNSDTPTIKKIELNDGYINLWNRKFYKLSGPDLPMQYLKKSKIHRGKLFKKYKTINSEDAKELLGSLHVNIYKILKNNESFGLNNIISEQYGLIFKPEHWYKIDEEDLSQSYDKIIAFIYNDLKYHNTYSPNEREPIIFYNRYYVFNIEEIQEKYPNSICVEYYFNEYLTLGFIFNYENSNWKLTSVINKCTYK